jgi:hypothetical protein
MQRLDKLPKNHKWPYMTAIKKKTERPVTEVQNGDPLGNNVNKYLLYETSQLELFHTNCRPHL